MTESSKRSLKLLAGGIGMGPLVVVLAALAYPEAFQIQNLSPLVRLSLAAFIGLSYCFGLTKWTFPNG